MPEMSKKLNRRSCRGDNRGVTFVEVIISMLVLSIAVVSLLGAFMLSFRINLKSRRALSASIVAQNVMECVKEYSDFHAVVTSVSGEMKSFLPGNYAESFASTADGFSLDRVVEGSSEFMVEVSYDRTVFNSGDKSGINDYELPDLTTLDSEKTIVICPSGIATGGMEQAAISYFVEMWVEQQWAAHSSLEEEEEYTGPTTAEIALQRSQIRTDMKGALTLELSQTPEGSRVTAKLVYSYGGGEWPAYHMVSDTVTNPENVYVFYDPVQLVAKGADEYEITDTITLRNFNREMNLFLAVQESIECLGVNAGKLTGPRLANELSTGPVTVYASTELGMDMNALTGFQDAKMLVAKKSYDRMQNVTVKVYLKSTGELMSTMETDISQ